MGILLGVESSFFSFVALNATGCASGVEESLEPNRERLVDAVLGKSTRSVATRRIETSQIDDTLWHDDRGKADAANDNAWDEFEACVVAWPRLATAS